MATLRIERVPIQTFNLGWFGGDHMHLALQLDDLVVEQDRWWVMEGIRGAPTDDVPRLGVLGWDGVTTLSAANRNLTGDALAAVIGTPHSRGSTLIPLGGNELSMWIEMADYAREIEAEQFPYIGFAGPLDAKGTINSSSVIASLLFSIGVDIADYLPQGLRISPGWTTLVGTTGDDTLTMQGSFRNLYGGSGEDTLTGTDGNVLPEKLYGGYDDDLFIATTGINYYHGGEFGLIYKADGYDTVKYENIGQVHVEFNKLNSEHKFAEFYVFHSGGVDSFFSIEGLRWNLESNTVTFGKDVEIIPDDLRFDLGDQSSLDGGDKVDFSAVTSPIIVNVDADGVAVVRAIDAEDADKGIWLDSVEWIIGSEGDDKLYVAPTVTTLEGGGGNDLIDARLSTAFSGQSLRGYDVELSGGAGDDTIVAGSGRTVMSGGDGADRFVLSAVTESGGQQVELVVEDGDASDRIYIPHDLFNLTFADFEGSPLFPLLGAMSQFPGADSFEDLPQNQGSMLNGLDGRTDFLRFEWQLQDDIHYGSDQTQGVIEFTGAVFYNRDGSDLLIHVFQGEPFEVTEDGDNGAPWTHTINLFYASSETIIRVKDFAEGDLGIFFHDRGEPDSITVDTDHGRYSVFDYPGWDAGVLAMTNGGTLVAPIEERPDAPTYNPEEEAPEDQPPVLIGTGGDDVIAATTGPARLSGGSGNDTLTGSSGADVLDGGTGDDAMTGGGGNDVYVVDATGDTVEELAGGGGDRVVSSIDYTLSANVEHLDLSGGAVVGAGNELANRLQGTDGANELHGLGGADRLVGNGGNDLLAGGAGSDAYIYAEGDGDDTIREFSGEGSDDVLVLAGFRPDGISLYRLESSPGTLVFALPDGSRIRIENFDGSEDAGIEGVLFDDGLSWSEAELDTFASLSPVIINDVPFARDDTDLVAASGTSFVPIEVLLANDRDSDGDTLSIVAVGNVSAGASLTLLEDGRLVMSTAEGFSGDVTFTYTIADGSGGTSTADVFVQIIPNFAPVATGPLADETIGAGTLWSYTLAEGFFSDADLDPLTIRAGVAGAGALPSWLAYDAPTRTLSGTPPPDFTGTLAVVFTASDGLSETTATLNVVAGTGNRPPTAAADSGTTEQYVPLAFTAALLLANDEDPDGDAVSIVGVGAATHGSVVQIENGDILFTPDDGYVGTASFDYTIIDGNGGTSTATVSIAVTAPQAGITIVGNNQSNVLAGTAGSDIIEGRGGADTMSGDRGNDVFLINGNDGLDGFDGGLGYDEIQGGAGDDVIGLAQGMASLVGIEGIDGGAGFDVLRLSDGNDVLDLSAIMVIGIERIRGHAGNDTIIGSSGADTINGNRGDDWLDGGLGDDIIAGGAGADVFVIGLGAGHDTIADFQRGGRANPAVDVIDVSALGLHNLGEVQAVARQDGADTLIEIDAGQSIRLVNITLTSLTADDFRFA